MNLFSFFKSTRTNKRVANKLGRVSDHHLIDMGFKRVITAADTIRFI